MPEINDNKTFIKPSDSTSLKHNKDQIEAFIAKAAFNEMGLLPVIAQQHDSKEVLMLAWMSEESLRSTLETGYATYWSRSRRQLWKKGETSGNVQKVLTCTYDCDKDTLLLSVDQKGPACHTGEPKCFFEEPFKISDL